MSIIKINAQDVASRILKLAGAAKNVQDEIHTLAVACLDHVKEHGNTTLTVNLLNALPKGVRREGLAVWFGQFSSSKLTLKLVDGAYTAKLDKKRVEEDFLIEEADATPFYDLTKEKRPGETMTVEKLAAWIKKRANDDTEFTDGTPKVSEEARDLAAAICGFLEERNRPALKAVA
jgi:hypothetical protein